MLSRREVEVRLLEDVSLTKRTYQSACLKFKTASTKISSGLPHPGGQLRIRAAAAEHRVALAAYNEALKEFNTFLITGVAPDWLSK